MSLIRTARVSTLALSIVSATTAAVLLMPTAAAAANNNDYFRCAKFSMSVLNACLERADNAQKQRSCRNHYQGNITRCQQANR